MLYVIYEYRVDFCLEVQQALLIKKFCFSQKDAWERPKHIKSSTFSDAGCCPLSQVKRSVGSSSHYDNRMGAF